MSHPEDVAELSKGNRENALNMVSHVIKGIEKYTVRSAGTQTG